MDHRWPSIPAIKAAVALPQSQLTTWTAQWFKWFPLPPSFSSHSLSRCRLSNLARWLALVVVTFMAAIGGRQPWIIRSATVKIAPKGKERGKTIINCLSINLEVSELQVIAASYLRVHLELVGAYYALLYLSITVIDNRYTLTICCHSKWS